MNRRPRLPGADELFRGTGTGTGSAIGTGPSAQPVTLTGVAPSDQPHLAAARNPDDGERDENATPRGADSESWGIAAGAAGGSPVRPVRVVSTSRRQADSRPTGRERHEEKITVYCSPEELMQIEQARLTLRGGHGLAVDRGRIVREAVAVVLADLDAKGEASILVRRLRGR